MPPLASGSMALDKHLQLMKVSLFFVFHTFELGVLYSVLKYLKIM